MENGITFEREINAKKIKLFAKHILYWANRYTHLGETYVISTKLKFLGTNWFAEMFGRNNRESLVQKTIETFQVPVEY